MTRGLYRYGKFCGGIVSAPAVVEKHECPGCFWTFQYPEMLAAHVEKCDQAKAKALPKDDDAAGWTALAERMKRAALEAQAKGRADEYEAGMRRSEACAEKARAAMHNEEEG